MWQEIRVRSARDDNSSRFTELQFAPLRSGGDEKLELVHGWHLLTVADAVLSSKGARMDETELIAAARSGDEDAFAELYRQHIGYVRAIGRMHPSHQRVRGYVPGYVSAGVYTAR